jgi:hypothetical protein
MIECAYKVCTKEGKYVEVKRASDPSTYTRREKMWMRGWLINVGDVMRRCMAAIRRILASTQRKRPGGCVTISPPVRSSTRYGQRSSASRDTVRFAENSWHCWLSSGSTRVQDLVKIGSFLLSLVS